MHKENRAGKGRLVEFLREAVQKGWTPGFAAVFVTEEGVETHNEGRQALLPEVEALRRDAIFDVASLTKVLVTTTLILQFVAEKQVSLEDAVQEHLPDFIHPEVTVADLLLHRAGLPAGLAVTEGMSLAQFRQAVWACPLDQQGATLYSDVGFILLGWLLEGKSGQSLKELAESRIVEPLGLRDSGYRLVRPGERFVPTEKRATGMKRGEVHDSKAAFLKGVSGHAGWFTTLDDCGLILQNLLHPDPTGSVFPAAYWEWMSRWAQDERTLGWEWRKNRAGDAYLYHTGFTGVFMYMNVRTRQGGAVLTNSIHPNRETPYKEERNRLLQLLFSEAEL